MAGPLPPQHCQVLLLLWERCMSVMVSVLQVSIPLWRNISSGSSSAGRNQTSEWVKKTFPLTLSQLISECVSDIFFSWSVLWTVEERMKSVKKHAECVTSNLRLCCCVKADRGSSGGIWWRLQVWGLLAGLAWSVWLLTFSDSLFSCQTCPA